MGVPPPKTEEHPLNIKNNDITGAFFQYYKAFFLLFFFAYVFSRIIFSVSSTVRRTALAIIGIGILLLSNSVITFTFSLNSPNYIHQIIIKNVLLCVYVFSRQIVSVHFVM